MIAGDANPIAAAGVSGLRALYLDRATSPQEALDVFLARIDRLNAGLNVVAALDVAGARAAAAQSAGRYAGGKSLGPLDGAPILVKANIAVRGLPWTAALSAYRDVVAETDAPVVARLRAAGAVILGTVTMHEAAFGATNDSPLYGPSFNPVADGLTPGGSSGGSAAATAAGLCAAALGSDTLGSVRIPAAYCGGVGLKPSFGRLARTGLRLLSYSLDTIGFHTRSARDLAPLLNACEGACADDPVSRPFAAEREALGLRIGVVDLAGVDVEPAVMAAFETGLARLSRLGAQLTPVRLACDLSLARKQGLIVCEAEGAALMRPLLEDANSGLSPTLRALLEYGAGLPAVRLAEAQLAIADAARAVRRAFDAVDALVLPTAPQLAFRQGAPAPVNQADLTAPANFAGAPAASAPLHRAGGAPAGLQIVTPPGADHRAIALAAALEETP